MMPVGNFLAPKAAGTLLVSLSLEEFAKLLARMNEPLVVVVEGDRDYHYLTCHKGLPFYLKSRQRLTLPDGAEVVSAEGILFRE